MLEFDWDEENVAHIAEHEVTPEEVESVLEGSTIDVEYQDWHEEERFAEVGLTSHGRVLMVITTWRGLKIRPVTAYDAPRELAQEYFRSRGTL
jgi:hypothetical protein